MASTADFMSAFSLPDDPALAMTLRRTKMLAAQELEDRMSKSYAEDEELMAALAKVHNQRAAFLDAPATGPKRRTAMARSIGQT